MKTNDYNEMFETEVVLDDKLEGIKNSLTDVIHKTAKDLAENALREGLTIGFNVSRVGRGQHHLPGNAFAFFNNGYHWFGRKHGDIDFPSLDIDLLEELKEELECGNFNAENRSALLETVDKFRKCIDFIEANMPS